MEKAIGKITALLCLALAVTLCGCQEPPEPQPTPEIFTAPNTPSGLRVDKYSIEEANIIWDVFGYLDGYNVYRSDSAEGKYTNVDKIGMHNNPYSIRGLPPKTPYYYKLSTYRVNPNTGKVVESSLSEYVIVTMPDLRYPPDEVSVTLTNQNSVMVSWHTDYHDVQYKVYRDDDNLAGTTSGLFYEDTGLSSSTVYSYTVACITGDGEGPRSPAVSIKTKPAVPVIHAQVSYLTGNAGIRVSWDLVSGADSYNVYRGDSADGPYTLIKAGEGVNLIFSEYTDSGFARNTLYYYKVSAVNESGESDLSEYAVMLVWAAGPSGIQAEFIQGAYYTADYIKIDWDPYPDATEYRLYSSYSDTSNAMYSFERTSSTNTLNDTNARAAGHTYYYRVTAVVDGYETELSSIASATNTRPPSSGGGSGSSKPASPTGVNITYSAGLGVKITWNSVQGATSYRVYRRDLKIGSSLPLGTGWSTTSSGTSAVDLWMLGIGHYEYYVVAINEYGSSFKSSSVFYGH